MSFAVLLSPVHASAQADGGPTDEAYRKLYGLALKCFVANGHAEGERSERGDKAGAAKHNAMMRKAHETAGRAGAWLGYGVPRMEADYRAAADRELPRLLRDPSYFANVAAECRQLDLM